ncbi:ricin B-like lectin [Obba rivulosa]|uniref:Ricin B-like lectin n=1 Tax=Obba rivulosa TaxID=1052685 RepID=A0A8E2AWA7_9APHY|nr:ricin B-like lectin [Obba rivulosa]
MSLQPNRTYILVNAKSGTVLDLSASDNKTVTGWSLNNGDNQKWYVQRTDTGWVFRNVNTGYFLGIEGDPQNWTPVIASENETVWDIWPDDENRSVYRICLPSTNFNIDLSNGGLVENGTKVTLWEKWLPGPNQTWRFQPGM